MKPLTIVAWFILFISVISSSGQIISSDAEWPCFRRDLFNTGISHLNSNLTNLEELWSFKLGGGIDAARMKDVDGDGFDEIFILNAGKIIAYQEDGTLIWESPLIGVNYLLDIVDLDGDRTFEIVSAIFEPPTISILSATSGEMVWQHFFPPPAGSVYPAGIKIADLDKSGDGKLELFCWPWSGGADGFAFTFKQGVANGEIIWSSHSDIAKNYSPQVMIADMDCDSIPEVVIGTYGHVYAWHGNNGKQCIDFKFTTGEHYGRNYGIIKITNIDKDPYPEVAILAHSLNEHLTMIDNKGQNESGIELSLLWDKWFEYGYPEDLKALRVSPNSLADLDNDGEMDLACAIFNDAGDNQWHLMIYNAQTGATELDLPGYYLYDIQDLDKDGVEEIFSSKEPARKISRNNFCILKAENHLYSIVFSQRSITPVVENEPRLPLDVNGTSGTDVLFVRDLDCDGTLDLFALSNDRIYGYRYKDDRLINFWKSSALNDASVIADVGKTTDQVFKTVLISSVNGHTFLMNATGEILKDITVGNFCAMPIAADVDNDGFIEVMIEDALGFVNVFDVHAPSHTKPKLKWRQPGTGKSAKYNLKNATPYVDDIDTDGQKEVFIASGNKLLMFDSKGRKQREYTFASYPYEWVTGYFNADSIKDLFVAVNTGDSHTNGIYVYDGKGSKIPIWHKDFGPYSGYVAVYDFTKDGIDDIVMREHYDLITLNGKNGQQIESCSGAYYHTPILMDVNSDGHLDVINGGGLLEVSVNHLLNDGQNITEVWQQKTGREDCYGRMPGTADVDNDGHVEIGVSSSNGTFTCYDASDGKIKWTFNLNATASDIICMDADNDHRLEFIFGGSDGYLYIMNGETSASNRIEVKYNLNAQAGSPIVADLNGDGLAELLVTTFDGKLHCLAGSR